MVLAGHAGKLVKLAGGVFQTHSRYADCRSELFCAHAALCGADAQTCRALMDAARSVREEKPVKRVSYRAALIAAVILLAAMAVAYAAVRLGWIEYFSTALPCPGRHRKRLRPASQRPVR